MTIDLDAIRDNYHLLQKRVANVACAAVLKADAYGLGASCIAPVLAENGCRHFFVAHLDEGIALRPFLPKKADVFVLHGPPVGAEQEFVQHRLIPVLNSMQQVNAWRQLAHSLERHLPAVIQLDSGMSRFGLSPDELDAWVMEPNFLRGIDLRYLMSHLACAEQQDHPLNQQQLQFFQAARKRLPACPESLANSSGIFLGPDFHLDLVRPGAALYGIAPVAGAANPMKPVVRLQGKIVQTRTVERGTGVGYGSRYLAPDRRCIATVSVGYADGWLRNISQRGAAFIGDIRVPFAGNVSMDSITLDVTGIDPALLVPGSYVDLLSASQTVDTVAGYAGTIGYEILTSLGSRYHREYIGGK